MKEILKITFSLTAVCIAAAVILGAVYTQTAEIRKAQEEKAEKETIQSLLGYAKGTKTPSDLHVYAVYRYVIAASDGKTMLGYVLPVEGGEHVLAEIDLSGKPGKVLPLKGTEAELAERASRDLAVNDALGKGANSLYAQTLYIADLGNKRLGYVVPTVTQGFKTFIDMMVSLDPKFTLNGIAITKMEEDPGLGANIVKPYFKNQFSGKTAARLKTLEVTKKPLPPNYRTALEPQKAKEEGWSKAKVEEIRHKYDDSDIYALTGATISSRAVTNGVKNAVRKFTYRLNILKEAIKKKDIKVAF